MSNKVVAKHNIAFKKCLTKIVKQKMKKDKNLRAEIAGFKQHFKTDKWSLGYEVNRSLNNSRLNPYEFNVLLELLNYRIYYEVASASVLFKPRSTK